MFSGNKFPSCGPVIEKEFLVNEVHLNFCTIRRFVLFDGFYCLLFKYLGHQANNRTSQMKLLM